MMIRLLLLLLIGYSSALFAGATLRLHWQGKEGEPLQFANAPWLADALLTVTTPLPPYWASAQITTAVRLAEAQGEQQQLLARLDSLQRLWQQQEQMALAESAQALRLQVQALAVTGRFNQQVDPDALRVPSARQPRLEGEYLLYLAPRRLELDCFGLLAEPGARPLIAQQGLANYWSELEYLEGGDPNEVYIISPKGEFHLIPLAHWHRQHLEPMPGGALFVGFEPARLPAGFADLNRQVAALLAQRVPL